jgi:dUTP pyrophosphatase
MSDKITIRYKKLHKDAKPPKQAKDGDAGYDLFALEPTTLNTFERKAIKTGIAIEIPKGY